MIMSATRSIFQTPREEEILTGINETNGRRLRRLAVVLAVVHIVHVAIFWPFVPGASDTVSIWRNGVIAAHLTMLLVAISLAGTADLLRRKTHRPLAFTVLAEVIGFAYLLFGAVVTVIDQQVTSSVTPWLVSCLGVGVVALVRPIAALLSYGIAWLFFVKAVAWTQTDPTVLLSVRVNSITISGIGLAIAMFMWHQQVLSLRQTRQIEAQKLELEEMNRELKLLAAMDPLTGLRNRTVFMLEARTELARAIRTKSHACIIMLDIDHFKAVNDTYGHPAGDDVLREVALVMTGALREMDQLARFGGEEFAILLPETDIHSAMLVAERLRGTLEDHPFMSGNHRVRVTGSFGVAQLSADRLDALSVGYRLADEALYRAKQNGRNCVRSA